MKESVVIIGGGIAGMETAASLLELGYSPILVEQSDHLGGHVASWYRLFPDMTPASEVVASLKSRLDGVTVFLETGIQFINRLRDGYNVMLSNGVSIVAKAVVMATGFKLFEAAKKEEYGYGIYDRVITNRDLEKWFSGIPDERIPSAPWNIGFVHCVGSRDVKAGNTQCSKVCCMTAIKQAIEMKEKFPDAEVYCFYMDLRLFGKKYEDFYISAQKDYGIHFLRGRVSEVSETIDGRLLVKAEDTLSGRPVKINMDLLVLMSGMLCNPAAASIASMVKAGADDSGFLRSRDNVTGVVESERKGLFFAGACTGAKTVPETIAEARSAALSVHNYLRRPR
ncbi:MAG: CoB--CoM heterodisulfide reductase iron-sulfur subunit A family protein [Bacteroidales bacterium]|nr:CoB--CoM heterodisulfide reductase iron-sulfur subunit A family protein [Bacteroidales bacterium]